MRSFTFLSVLTGLFLFHFVQQQSIAAEIGNPEIAVSSLAGENSIYFKANGVDPVWTLTISPIQIDFKTQATGFNPISAPHVEPVKGIDSNIKTYNIKTPDAELNVEITKMLCQNENSHERFPYAVVVSFKQGKDTTFTYFTGCGLYVTDTRLESTWVLDLIKTDTVTAADFNDTLPFVALRANGNSFSGYGGCNTIQGRIFSERNLLRFTDFVVSKRTCAATNREKEFINSLKFSTQYIIEGDRLILSNPGGPMLTFKKSG